MTPAGLMHLSRADLRRVWVLYALIAACLLAIPALVTHRRGNPSHPTEQEVLRGTTAHGR